jgi:hypothetical protein
VTGHQNDYAASIARAALSLEGTVSPMPPRTAEGSFDRDQVPTGIPVGWIQPSA